MAILTGVRWYLIVILIYISLIISKESSNYCTIALISHSSKVMVKILQAKLQQYVDWELPDVQAGFRKGRGTRDQIANIRWIIEKAREFQKKSISALLTMPKALTMWITTNYGQFFKKWEYQTTWPASWETYMQVRKQQLELDTHCWAYTLRKPEGKETRVPQCSSQQL